VTVFIVIVGSIFILPNRWFAWFEYVTSVLKIIAFLIVVIASICILAGAGPRDIDVGGHNWKGALAFKNSFAVSAMPLL
jgi:amino acid transporter